MHRDDTDREVYMWLGVLLMVTAALFAGDVLNVTQRVAELLALLPRHS